MSLRVDEAEAFLRYAPRATSIMDAVPIMVPTFQRPTHLEPLARIMRRMHRAACGDGEPLRVCLSAPPQVGKSTLVECALAWWLARSPEDFLAFVSYAASLAEDKSRRIRRLAREIGVELMDDTSAVDLWRTTAGGGLLARGIDGGITGQSALKAIVIDDPYKNRAEAESKLMRRRKSEEMRSTILTRCHPYTSVLVMHTRWHGDDLTGELTREGWEHVVIKAVADDGTPLWPEHGCTREYWDAQRKAVGERAWWSLYQGEPRPREGKVFSGASYYTQLPSAYSVSIGLDFAYSAKKASDYSVAVAIAYDASADRTYILDVLRRQCSAPDFADELQRWKSRWPHARMHAYIGGTEQGTVDFLRTSHGLHINALPAREDKYSRAVSAAAAWTQGRVFVRDGAEWAPDFVDEVCDFTGGGDDHDDQVDAFVAAFDNVSQMSTLPLGNRTLDLRPSYESGVTRRFTPRGVT